MYSGLRSSSDISASMLFYKSVETIREEIDEEPRGVPWLRTSRGNPKLIQDAMAGGAPEAHNGLSGAKEDCGSGPVQGPLQYYQSGSEDLIEF